MTEEREPKSKADLFENFKPKTAFLIGLIGGFVVLAAIGFFVMLAVNLNSKGANKVADNNQQPAVTQPTTNPQPNYAAVPAVDEAKDNIRGSKNAKVTIVEYSDFECPFCDKVEPTLEQVLTTYKDQVRIIYRHFPLSFHPYAEKAAEASQCAADQGKFWDMHDKLFAQQTPLTNGVKEATSAVAAPGRVIVQAQGQSGPTNVDITDTVNLIKQYAKDLGLDSNKFNGCLDSGQEADRVAQNLQEAVTALPQELQGTPAIFINNKQFVAGAYPFEYFKQIIDGMLK